MSRPYPSPSRKRLLAGLTVIGGGSLLLLNNLGIVSLFGVLQFWPTVFMVLGALLLFKGGHLRRYLSGSLLLGLGVLMTLDQAGILSFKLQQWWPLFLIYGGLMLLLPKAPRDCRPGGKRFRRQTDSNDRINSKLLMSASELRSEAEDFSGGELSLVMSGLKLDLRTAHLHGEAELRVEMMLAGLELRVPPDWLVEVELSPLMGGVENRTTPPLNRSKRLVLRGDMAMSGIEIRN